MDKLNVLTVWTNGPSEKPLGKQALSEENITVTNLTKNGDIEI